MYGYRSHSAVLEQIGTLDNDTVPTHQRGRLEICDIANEKAIAGGIYDKGIAVHSKTAASADNVLVIVSVLGNVLDCLTVQRSCSLKPKRITIGIFPHAKYPFQKHVPSRELYAPVFFLKKVYL